MCHHFGSSAQLVGCPRASNDAAACSRPGLARASCKMVETKRDVQRNILWLPASLCQLARSAVRREVPCGFLERQGLYEKQRPAKNPLMWFHANSAGAISVSSCLGAEYTTVDPWPTTGYQPLYAPSDGFQVCSLLCRGVCVVLAVNPQSCGGVQREGTYSGDCSLRGCFRAPSKLTTRSSSSTTGST